MKKAILALLIIGCLAAVALLFEPDVAPATIIEGTPSPVAVLEIDVARWLTLLTPASESPAAAALRWCSGMGMEQVRIHLHDTPAGRTPIVVIPDQRGTVSARLIEGGWFAPTATDLAPRRAAWPELLRRHPAIMAMHGRPIRGQLVIAAPEILDALQDRRLHLGQAFAARLAAEVPDGASLVRYSAALSATATVGVDTWRPLGVAVLGEDLTTWFIASWEQIGAALESIGGATRGFAVTLAIGEDGMRRVTLVQYSAYTDHARRCAGLLHGDPAATDPRLRQLLDVLNDPEIEHTSGIEGRVVRLDLRWHRDFDGPFAQHVAEALVDSAAPTTPTTLRPTSGVIQTVVGEPPVLSATLDPTVVQQALTADLEQCFHPVWTFADDDPHVLLEIDPPLTPNVAMARGEIQIVEVLDRSGTDVLRRAAGDRSPFDGGQQAAHLRVPIQPGVAAADLVSARLRVRLDLPTEVEVFGFAPAAVGAAQRRQGVLVRIEQVAADVAGVRCTGAVDGVLLVARDENGAVLAIRTALHAGPTTSARFAGQVAALDVAVARRRTPVTAEIVIDLNGGEPLRLPEAPSAEVPVRWIPDRRLAVQDIDPAALAATAVAWQAVAGRPWEAGLRAELPRGVTVADCDWALYWFDGDSALTIDGAALFDGQACVWHPQHPEALNHVLAVRGRLAVGVPAGISTWSCVRTQEGMWVTPESAGGGGRLRFDRNTVMIDPGQATVLEVRALDPHGQRLRTEGLEACADGVCVRCWGMPHEVEVVLAAGHHQQAITIAHDVSGLDAARREQIESDVAAQRGAGRAAVRILQAVEAGWDGYQDDVAGWYYLHDATGRPRHAVPEALARACSAGAARFGYALTPANDYVFALVAVEPASGTERAFAWEHGTVLARVAERPPAVAAYPLRAGLPTVLATATGLFHKRLGPDQRLTAAPETPWTAGWCRAPSAE